MKESTPSRSCRIVAHALLRSSRCVRKMDGNMTEGPTLFCGSPILKLNVDEELFLVTK